MGKLHWDRRINSVKDTCVGISINYNDASTDLPYRVTCKQFYFSHGSGVTQNKNSQVIVTDVRSSYLYCPPLIFYIDSHQVMVRYLNTSQAVCSYHAGPMSPRRLPSHSRSPMRVAKVIRSLWHQSNDALSPVNRPLSQATLRQYEPSECVTFHWPMWQLSPFNRISSTAGRERATRSVAK